MEKIDFLAAIEEIMREYLHRGGGGGSALPATSQLDR